MVLGTGKQGPLSIAYPDGYPEARFESASLHQPAAGGRTLRYSIARNQQSGHWSIWDHKRQKTIARGLTYDAAQDACDELAEEHGAHFWADIPSAFELAMDRNNSAADRRNQLREA